MKLSKAHEQVARSSREAGVEVNSGRDFVILRRGSPEPVPVLLRLLPEIEDRKVKKESPAP